MSNRRLILCLGIVASSLATLGGCAPAGAGPSVEPPTPLSNVTPDMLNPDLTFRKNGLVPVDPSEQI